MSDVTLSFSKICVQTDSPFKLAHRLSSIILSVVVSIHAPQTRTQPQNREERERARKKSLALTSRKSLTETKSSSVETRRWRAWQGCGCILRSFILLLLCSPPNLPLSAAASGAGAALPDQTRFY